jgi:type I restriction enzyme M protein
MLPSSRIIFGLLFIKRLSDEFDRKREHLRKKDFAHITDPALLKELLADKTSYGETFFVPVRARWHESWRDEDGDEVPALKDLKQDIGNMLNENDALAAIMQRYGGPCDDARDFCLPSAGVGAPFPLLW